MFVLDLGSSELRVSTSGKSAILPVNRSVVHGVIADDEMLVRLLSHTRQTLEPSLQSFVLRPPVKALIHAQYRFVYQEALTRALKRSGFGTVELVHQAIGVDALSRRREERGAPCLYLDIGEGKLDVSIVADERIVAFGGQSFGVDRLRSKLRSCVETNLQITISEQELVSLLLQLSVEHEKAKHHHDVRGKDLRDFTLVSLHLRSEQLRPVLETWLQEVALLIEQLLEQLPSELHTKLLGTGIRVYGGGSRLDGIDQWLAERFEMPVGCLDQPTKLALKGALV